MTLYNSFFFDSLKRRKIGIAYDTYAILTLLIPEVSGKTQFLIKIFHTLKRSLKVICGN